MSEHRHTVITSTPAERVELHVHTGSPDARWHRFLNCLWDEGVIASLSDRAYRVLGALLRLRKDDGTAFASIDTLCTLTGYAERSVQSALKELRSHPRRLLAVIGRDVYEVLPGFTFAGRTVLHEPPQDPADLRTVLRPTCVPLMEARARQNTHSKTRDENPIQKPEPQARARRVSEWPEPDLLAQMAIDRGDVRGLLIALGVWHYAAEALAEIPTITVARVMDDARAVGADHKAKNKPRYLAGRLARGFGLTLPDCPGVKRFTREQLDQGWGNIQRLRAERAGKAFEQRFHDGRGPTAAEYARTEDE